MISTGGFPRPELTDDEAQAAIARVLENLDYYQEYELNARINARQIRDLLDPRGMWRHSAQPPQ